MLKHFLMLLFLLPVAPVVAEEGNDAAGNVYLPLENTMSAVNATLAEARDTQRQALFVMGANWCHDSRALARNLAQEEVVGEVGKRFVVRFIDVGFLEDNFDVNRRFGLPVIFGTPTVLAVDPATQALLNRDAVNIWPNAATMDAAETLAHLTAIEADPQLPSSKPAPGSLLASIDRFELEQARRIYRGFSVVGPLLAAFKAGEDPEQFEAYWQQLGAMRSQLGKDLPRLRREARAMTAAGTEGGALEFPVYAPFDWESGELAGE